MEGIQLRKFWCLILNQVSTLERKERAGVGWFLMIVFSDVDMDVVEFDTQFFSSNEHALRTRKAGVGVKNEIVHFKCICKFEYLLLFGKPGVLDISSRRCFVHQHLRRAQKWSNACRLLPCLESISQPADFIRTQMFPYNSPWEF